MRYRIILIISFSLLSFQLFAQIEGIVINKATNIAIPYANIWVADKDIGTTSNSDGIFLLKDSINFDTLIVTAIGYEKKYFQIDSSNVIIALNPKIYQIPEVRINPGSNKKLVIDRFKESDIFSSVASSGPAIYAKFFQFREAYGPNATIKNIKFITSSKTRAKINLRLFSVNANGEPGDDILGKNLIITVETGKNINSIELPNETIVPFPETGIFIAFEFLIIKENEYIIPEYKNLQTGEVIKNNKDIAYMPFLGQMKSENPANWVFSKGKWHKIQKALNHASRKEEIAVELTLKL